MSLSLLSSLGSAPLHLRQVHGQVVGGPAVPGPGGGGVFGSGIGIRGKTGLVAESLDEGLGVEAPLWGAGASLPEPPAAQSPMRSRA